MKECIDDLWKEYTINKTKNIRDKLIIHYSPLVNSVASKMHVHLSFKVEYDDLVSYGIFGLIDAIDKFEYNKNIKFETYAALRIRGEMFDNIRSLDWVPRDLRQINKKLEDAVESLTESLGRDPEHSEIADFMKISHEELDSFISKSSLSSLISLDEFSEKNHEINIHSSVDTPEEAYGKTEALEILTKAIEELRDNERKIITLYYFEELNFREIAEILEVSISRISQIHARAVIKLRHTLGDFKHFFKE